MTLEDIVDLVWRRAGDVDQTALRYTKNDIVKEISHARRIMAARQVVGLSDIAVNSDPNAEAITPEPTDVIGILLALATTIGLLRRTYAYRVDSGTLGISWQSGLESESTISAEAAYKSMIHRIEGEYEELLLIMNSPRAGTRPQ